jgi:hypothetical protein
MPEIEARLMSSTFGRSAISTVFHRFDLVLTDFDTRQGFDRLLRRVKFNDPETGKPLVFLTNNFAYRH